MILLIIFSILMFFAIIKTFYDQRKEKEEYKRLQQAVMEDELLMQSLAEQERQKDYKRFSDEFQSIQALYDNTCDLQSYVEEEYQSAIKRGNDDLIQKYLSKMISLDKQIISLRKKLNKLYDYEEKHF